MPFTRQRHHGMNETLASKSHLTTESHPAHHPLSARKTHSSQAIQHRATRRATRHTGTLALSLVTAAFSHVPSAFAKKPSQRNKTAPSQQPAAKPTGVWGWTSGAQTYLRSRPGALTAPVAKVDKHTKLFVWGKFDGWYRVETPDHVFGWVYHSYINSPDEAKLQELSHYKAKLASDRTANQPMYGSTRLLQHQYALYKAPGAAQALAAQGVRVAVAPPTHTPAKSSLRMASKPAPQSPLRIATHNGAPKANATGAETPLMQNVSVVTERYASRDFTSSHSSSNPAPLAAMNEVGTVRFAPPLPTSRHAAAPATPTLPITQTNTTPAVTSAVPDSKVAPATNVVPTGAMTPSAPDSANASSAAALLAPMPPLEHKATPAKAATEATRPHSVSQVSHKTVAKTAPVKVAMAPVKPPTAQSIRSQRRLAALLRRQHAKDAQREQLRVKMGNPATMVPPVASPQLAPISPSELLKARDTFLSSQSNNAPTAAQPAPDASTPAVPTGSNAIVAPSGLKSDAAPLAPVHATPVTQPATSPSRGGSPRDYAKAASLNHARFGDALVGQALTYRGYPYIRGAQSPSNGFDCSGLLYYLLRQRGYNPPRTASGYANYGAPVAKDKLQPGDILLFANTYKRGISHVAIYMGNDHFIHAANSGRGVTTDLLSSPYYAHKYYGARRVK